MTLAVSIFEGQRGKTGKRKSIDMGPTHEKKERDNGIMKYHGYLKILVSLDSRI
jgi:hypothetical protein